ncbi:MAG: PQQ-binding-like beta-propeller repeat protein [Acidobacteria bacterium]|nr:PQQ-binding-like beta-propeller repeat protein [Acidobacteriota bacterium]
MVPLVLLVPLAAAAQYAETPLSLGAVDGYVGRAAQIGRRLFIAGSFNHVSAPTGGAVVVDEAGKLVPGRFPRFDGTVNAIVADGLGGWVVVGGFTRVDGQPQAYFARVGPDRSVDPRYRITANGPIRQVAIAHGRVYLLGDFTIIDGVERHGLAALDTATGVLSGFAASFHTEGRRMIALSVSSIGVYVSAAGRLWGFDASNGTTLFYRDVTVNAIAATSARVYVGGGGSVRPVWAVDPLTGRDLAWSIGLTFRRLSDYVDNTSIDALLIDGGRLYLGGYFLTADNRSHLAAVDAASGEASPWRASSGLSPVTGLLRVGPAIVATGHSAAVSIPTRHVWPFDAHTGALLSWDPQPYGSVTSVSLAPEGAVIGGDFNGIDGVPRSSLASFDLDTGLLEAWTATPPEGRLVAFDTDGSFLFWFTHDARVSKIDPLTGAVLGTIAFGDDVTRLPYRIADGRIFVGVVHARAPAELAAITIADWSRQTLPVTFGPSDNVILVSLEAVGDTLYVAGTFATINGVPRPFLAAVHPDTGAVLPFAPSPDARAHVRQWGTRLVASGDFRRIGGERRRGLAELDPVTGRALDWNPDAPGGPGMTVGGDGHLYVKPSPTLSGRDLRFSPVALSPVTLQPLPWRLPLAFQLTFDSFSFLPDCLLVESSSVNCYPPALPSPTLPAVQQDGDRVTFQWHLPAGPPTWTAVRVEVGRREGASDVAAFDLPADATSLTRTVPPGTWFARVRVAGPTNASLPSPDVSFAIGPPDVPAPPLDATAITEGTLLTLQWRAPSTGTPPAYVIEAGTAAGLSDVARLPVSGAATTFTIDAPPGRYWGRVRALNGAGLSEPSGELILDVDATDSPCYGTALLAPLNLVASVTGRTVTLTWEQPDAGPVANTQRIVVGTAPGLDNLGAFGVPGPATSFTTTAPPGRYYVRVIGLNSCGASPYSNEVQVVVP